MLGAGAPLPSRPMLGCFLPGGSPVVPKPKTREVEDDLGDKTAPAGARVYLNSDSKGRSPARGTIPCVVSYQEKGDRLYTKGAGRSRDTNGYSRRLGS